MYKDCYEETASGVKIVDEEAKKALGGKFDVHKVDNAKYDQMVNDIKALGLLGDTKFDELGSYYDQLGFEGFKANVQLVDYL